MRGLLEQEVTTSEPFGLLAITQALETGLFPDSSNGRFNWARRYQDSWIVASSWYVASGSDVDARQRVRSMIRAST